MLATRQQATGWNRETLILSQWSVRVASLHEYRPGPGSKPMLPGPSLVQAHLSRAEITRAFARAIDFFPFLD